MKDFLEWVTLGSREEVIVRDIDPTRIPRHIAVIMDGNGRWAERRRLPRTAGHRAGVRPVRETIEACCRLEVEVLTLYAFSMENWKRPQEEVRTLWRLMRHYLHKELPGLKKNNVRFRVIGRVEELPEAVQKDLASAIFETASNTGLQLNVALNYGGRAELVDAVKAVVKKARDGEDVTVDEDAIGAELYTAGLPDPDLLIRTSGEMRISNFLLWQIAYAEICVTDKFWPDFDTVDLLESILNYQRRERRYGGLDSIRRRNASAAELVGARLNPETKAR
jgi:undecaprenyl diphosphate synthase